MKNDIQLRQDVAKELQWELSEDQEDIRVHVQDGVATLSGRVSRQADKQAAMRAARRVGAIVDQIATQDRLKVRPDAGMRRHTRLLLG